MGALVTYPDTQVRWHDTRKISLDKILQALNSGAGGGGVGGGTLSGSGVPSSSLGDTGDLYFDVTNRDLYGKVGSTWHLLVDIL